MTKRIKLTCNYGAAPDGDWYSELEFRAIEDHIEGWERYDHHGLLQIRRVLKGRLNWRRCAEFMSRRDPMYAIPEAALSAVNLTGEKGWRRDALKFCWARFGEEKELNYAREISKFMRAACR